MLPRMILQKIKGRRIKTNNTMPIMLLLKVYNLARAICFVLVFILFNYEISKIVPASIGP